jgi:hypothetical protein
LSIPSARVAVMALDVSGDGRHETLTTAVGASEAK